MKRSYDYPEELKPLDTALSKMEESPDVLRVVIHMVAELRAINGVITFDRVLIHLGSRQDHKGASILASLVVREDCRQRIAAALTAAPIGTAH